MSEKDIDLLVRASKILDEPRGAQKRLFMVQSPDYLLARTVEIAESHPVAQQAISHLVNSHTFRSYLKNPGNADSGAGMDLFDCEFLDYAIELTDFAVRMNDAKPSHAPLVHEYIFSMVVESFWDLMHVDPDERLEHGKAHCFVMWMHTGIHPRIRVSNTEREADLPFAIENMSAIEDRLVAVAQRGTTDPDTLRSVLALHPALGDAAL